jgi:hypothetical protein
MTETVTPPVSPKAPPAPAVPPQNPPQPSVAPPTPPVTPIQEPSAPQAPSPKKIPYLLIILMILLVAVVGAAAYYLGTRNKPSYGLQSNNPVNSKAPTATPPPKTETTDSLFSGKLTELQEDLKVLKQNQSDKLNNVPLVAKYYSAGVYQKGKWKGYTRIIALKDTRTPLGYETYVLATKDMKTFVLDPSFLASGSNPADAYDNIDRLLISSEDTLDSDHPEEIGLDTHFSLYRGSLDTISIATGKTDEHNNPLYEPAVLTDLQEYASLPQKGNLHLYAPPVKKVDINTVIKTFPDITEEEKALYAYRNQYLSSTTQVVALDSTGLPYKYTLTQPQAVPQYKTQKAAYDAAIAKKDWQNAVLPTYPNLHIDQNELVTDKAKFTSYEKAFPGACSSEPETYVVNISDNDLQPYGTTSNLTLFMLKDANHGLNKMEYDTKVSVVAKTSSEGPKYSYADYVAKNPLLFVKDPWGRWVALGEYELQLAGGCGKPVLYLYPTKPTQVQISFKGEMQFTTSIPTYHNTWNVLAQPNGQLKDLQPQYTDCSKIDSTKKGSEYAAQACANNQYPYIYWAGNSIYKDYPQITKGWYVPKADLASFMNNKLNELGLTSKEKTDMLEYWLPEMQAKNAPYYRVSFLQTQEMNEMIPMNISPAPNTLFRVFLDYQPLTKKPATPIQPQNLTKVQRNGFTVIEWGGLKK